MILKTNEADTELAISVVLAAHNEVATIAQVIADIETTLGTAVQLVVVDDGSTDGTGDAARKAGADVITLYPNQGKGNALREGIRRTTGDWVVFLDADGQDDPKEIPLLLSRATTDVTMVNGSRFLGSLQEGAISAPNKVGNVVLTQFMSLLFGHKITDSQAGFRAFRGEFVRAMTLRSDEYEIETEMLAKVLKAGERVLEVPVTRYERAGGETDFRRIRNGLRILGTMLWERFA